MSFETPVVLFIFKRLKAVDIIKAIGKVKPKKLYVLADYGRNIEENVLCDECRRAVEDAIDWDCEIIKNYAETNRGVYANIGLGAKWVFEREDRAIFLEDDNLPENTFFEFCEEMLDKYQNNDKILWVCGTNYMLSYKNELEHSYMFTRHMLPCGWASWSNKFNKYYDGDMEDYSKVNCKKAKSRFVFKSLAAQFQKCWDSEHYRKIHGEKFSSWDYQMDFSLKFHDLLGVVPANNQIKNIGVDEFSIHGGTSNKFVMTERFCENETYPIQFPLIHPEKIDVDKVFEKEIGKILLFPLNTRMKAKLINYLKMLLFIDQSESLTSVVKSRLNKIKGK